MLATMRKLLINNSGTIIKLNKEYKRVECLKCTTNRLICTTPCVKYKGVNEDEEQKAVSLFIASEKHKKDRDTFLDVINAYTRDGPRFTGHVRFIYVSLKYMKAFGVNEDLECYKAILDTLPKGKYVAKNLFLAEMWHFPKEQQAAIDLLEQMESNGVVPDAELETMILNIYGEHGFPLRKMRRMAYWQGKFKNLNPWPFPRPLPNDPLAIAKLAIEKIASVDVQSTVTVFDAKDVKNSIDKTWIVSASSPDQQRLIASHPQNVAAYVEGPFRIWVGKASVDYFILYTEPINRPVKEKIDIDDVSNLDISLWKKSKKALDFVRSIHEQDKMTVFGVCATGTSTKDSLLSWIRCLQIKNPALETMPILFKFITPDIPLRIESGDETSSNKKISEGAENIDN